MKTFKLSSIAVLLFVLSACGESTTGEQASTGLGNDQENNPGAPVALTQLAKEMFEEDEDSPPLEIGQMNMDIEEEMPNTAFDDIFTDPDQQATVQ